MADSTKRLSEYDYSQVLQKVYNPTEGTLATGSFIAGKLGNAIDREVMSSTVDRFHYFEGSTLLHTIEVTYNNSDHDEVDRVERIV